ncbi:hypothetical protein MMC11_004831 [Xylographa trunciseda]|nr:hypothetical protein [Xylographa trunciseda]
MCVEISPGAGKQDSGLPIRRPASMFERLPNEISAMIYQHLLRISAIEPRRARPCEDSGHGSRNKDPTRLQHYTHDDEFLCVALLRVSRTISQHASFFLYSENTFRVPLGLLDPFLATIGTTNATHLRDLNVMLDTLEIWASRFQLVDKHAFEFLIPLPNLRRLTLSHYPIPASLDKAISQPTMDVTLLANYQQFIQASRPALSKMFMRSEKDENHISEPQREVTITAPAFKPALNVGAHPVELQLGATSPRYVGLFESTTQHVKVPIGQWGEDQTIMTFRDRAGGGRIVRGRDRVEYRDLKLVGTGQSSCSGGRPGA